VTERSAMSCSAVFACVNLIAGSIGTLPLNVYQRTDKGREVAEGHPYWWLFNERPNPAISAAVFLEYLMLSLLFHGDAF
ncbi:phage portal protein, partial [Streptomyces caeruleatus]